MKMQIIKLLFLKTQNIILFVAGLFGLFLLGRNSKLSAKNKRLKTQLNSQNALLKKQREVINVRKNTKPTDIDGNIERMRQNKL